MIDADRGTPCHDTRTKLALACLAHLEQEETHLAGCLEAVQQLRAALMHGDQTALSAALDRQQEMARQGDELSNKRTPLIQSGAALLGIPAPSVTLQALADLVSGPVGEQLRQSRSRLQAMMGQLGELNGGNASLVYHCLDFLNPIVAEITGEETNGKCYSSAGTYQEGVRGSILSTRG